jgi:hypothetical protein
MPSPTDGVFALDAVLVQRRKAHGGEHPCREVRTLDQMPTLKGVERRH